MQDEGHGSTGYDGRYRPDLRQCVWRGHQTMHGGRQDDEEATAEQRLLMTFEAASVGGLVILPARTAPTKRYGSVSTVGGGFEDGAATATWGRTRPRAVDHVASPDYHPSSFLQICREPVRRLTI